MKTTFGLLLPVIVFAACIRNKNSDFNTFISRFNNDSVFQLNSISFPLSVKRLNDSLTDFIFIKTYSEDYILRDFSDKSVSQNDCNKTIKYIDKNNIVIQYEEMKTA